MTRWLYPDFVYIVASIVVCYLHLNEYWRLAPQLSLLYCTQTNCNQILKLVLFNFSKLFNSQLKSDKFITTDIDFIQNSATPFVTEPIGLLKVIGSTRVVPKLHQNQICKTLNSRFYFTMEINHGLITTLVSWLCPDKAWIMYFVSEIVCNWWLWVFSMNWWMCTVASTNRWATQLFLF